MDLLDQSLPKTATEGVAMDFIVEKNAKGQAVVDVKRKIGT